MREQNPLRFCTRIPPRSSATSPLPSHGWRLLGGQLLGSLRADGRHALSSSLRPVSFPGPACSPGWRLSCQRLAPADRCPGLSVCAVATLAFLGFFESHVLACFPVTFCVIDDRTDKTIFYCPLAPPPTIWGKRRNTHWTWPPEVFISSRRPIHDPILVLSRPGQ